MTSSAAESCAVRNTSWKAAGRVIGQEYSGERDREREREREMLAKGALHVIVFMYGCKGLYVYISYL